MTIFSRVVICVKSLMPEKFLNAAAAEGARIFRVRKENDRQIFITTDGAGAEKIRALAEKARLEWRIDDVRGISAVYLALKKRPTLPAAFIVMTACLFVFLTRIWVIEMTSVTGDIPDSAGGCLENSGIAPGMRAKDIDTAHLALDISAAKGVARASVAKKGAVLEIEIVPEDAGPELFDADSARDLVAACDGVISAVEVKNGTAIVNAGDTVRRGQILIYGQERAGGDAMNPIGALGRVEARIWAEGNAGENLLRTEKEYTGNFSRGLSVSILGKEIEIFGHENFQNCDIIVEEIPIGGLFVPLRIRRVTAWEYVPISVQADIRDVQASLAGRAIAGAEANMARMGMENTEIIDKWIDFSMIDSYTLHARAVIEFAADIAVTRQYLEDN